MPNATTTGIGATLRTARDALGVSVEEAAWRTRIRPEYLRALEDERFDALGHRAFARSHVHSYARFLGLDAGRLVREYSERFEAEEPSPIERLNQQVKVSRRPPKPNWLIAAGIASALLIGASVAGIVRGPGPRAGESLDPLPSLPAGAAAAAAPSAAAAPAPPPAAPVSVTLTAVGRSWVRLVVDGRTAFEGVLEQGTSRSFSGSERIDLTIGNAGVVRLSVNGAGGGFPGAKGAVYRASFGPRGELKPE